MMSDYAYDWLPRTAYVFPRHETSTSLSIIRNDSCMREDAQMLRHGH